MTLNGWKDRAARLFLSALAGKRVAFWISEEAECKMREFDQFGVAGSGAAIVMAHALESVDCDTATFILTGFEITVRRTDTQ
jgi:hypothetical protein